MSDGRCRFGPRAKRAAQRVVVGVVGAQVRTVTVDGRAFAPAADGTVVAVVPATASVLDLRVGFVLRDGRSRAYTAREGIGD